MQVGLETRSVHLLHTMHEWDQQQHQQHQQSPPPPLSSSASAALYATRRRSLAAAAVPPSVPPPSQPLPSLPVLSITESTLADYSPDGATRGFHPALASPPRSTATQSPSSSFARPSASAGLAAVAAYQQTRNASTSSNASSFLGPQPSPSEFPSVDNINLSDEPPPSMLRAISQAPAATATTSTAPHNAASSNGRLLSPQDNNNSRSTSSSGNRPSSRRALTRALELAREAVKLDSSNDDPQAAIAAYARSVALLSEVMERVMRGEDGDRRRRRRSVVAQEEEVRRLKNIHDTYAERMHILSMAYNVAPGSPTATSAYDSSATASTASTTSSTRTSSPFETPQSERGDPTTSETPSLASDDDSGDSPDQYVIDGGYSENVRDSTATFKAPIDPHSAYSQPQPAPRSPSRNVTTSRTNSPHPYATASSSPELPSAPPPGYGGGRTSVVPAPTRGSPSRMPSVGRPRASSTLPPLAPPPLNAPPPAPPIASGASPDVPAPSAQQQQPSAGHSRTPSAVRLAALAEDGGQTQAPLQTASFTDRVVFNEDPFRARSKSVAQGAGRYGDRELPPIPSSAGSGSSTSPVTPRNPAYRGEPGSPASSLTAFTTPRARTGSQLSVHSEGHAHPPHPYQASQPLIMGTTHQGTISQRRAKQTADGTTTSGGTSPTESTTSAGNTPHPARLTSSSLPASTANSLGLNNSRVRSSSQPGRRPSVAAAVSPPLPTANGVHANGLSLRKSSVPSKLGPNAQPPQLSIVTGRISPGPATAPLSLVPPPPIPPSSIPTTPTSPLPPAVPTEPLRKPYHLMNLLRHTMTSKSGGYITPRLHVPQEVWSQGGAKLANLPEKVRAVEVLCSALEEIQNSSQEFFGFGSLTGQGMTAIAKKEGEAWGAKLEDFATVCDGIVGSFGKKLGVGEGLITKKTGGVTSWGGKLTRQLDKLTNTKNLDSPASYVQGLARLFNLCQVLDEHTKALYSQPVAPVYSSLPVNVQSILQARLRHTSEFFANVVLTFVIRDLSLLLDKYAKKCEKWLAE